MWPQTAFKRELQNNRLARYLVLVELDRRKRASEPPEAEPDERDGWFQSIRGLLRRTPEKPLPPIAERPELVVGFIGLWMLPDEAHIVTIAVRETHRRRGFGELLLIRAIDLARAEGHGLVTLECRVSNDAALAMYAKYEFERVGVRPRYYSDNQEDAYVMTVGAVLSPEYSKTLERLRREHARRWGEIEATA